MSFITIVLTIALSMLLVERLLKPGRKWPAVSSWWFRAILLNALGISTTFIYGTTFDDWFIDKRLWSLQELGLVPGAVIGYLVLSFFNYWWHRMRHVYGFFWRWFHQIHHSAQRIEVITTFYKHPLEAIANSTVSAPILYLLVGLDASAAAGALMIAGLIELFYHWNIPTPYWLGFIIQRPEAHLVHHQQGLHSYNYADIPIWDMLFGTFKNPKSWSASCGLGAENEERLGEMLRGIDISTTPIQTKVKGLAASN